ncbi:MAG: acetyl-CoA carboxylase biotin carboxyl carrier protein subunit [Alphaproteobacteria bacterium]|nr:acetyl-CoA carboxylase biotin carboxyl carrier protein subunit [Alphaproteobacteria bacterium]
MSLSLRDVNEILEAIDRSACDDVVLEIDDLTLIVRREPNPALLATGPLIAVKAPSVGTFFSGSREEAVAYVQVGMAVAAGAPLASIRVMDLWTVVTAPAAGVVAEIRPRDGDLVEYDQPIMALRSYAA